MKFDLEKIKIFCVKHHIKLAILHGSYATGMATKDSDIDVALLFHSGLQYKNMFKTISDAVDIFGDKYDSVFLNGAEPLICYEVAMNGKPLFEEKKDAFDEYQIYAMARYQDTKKFRILEKECLGQKIREME